MRAQHFMSRFGRPGAADPPTSGPATTFRAAGLMAFLCLAASAAMAAPFTYVHVMGTGDATPEDPNQPAVSTDPTIAACDIGILTDSGFMSNVCSFDGDKNSDGGVFHPTDAKPYRSFRREDPLPGQSSGFETAIIPFGYPAVHPTTGDTYVTAFFDRIPGDDTGLSNRPGGRQEGVYVYDRLDKAMRRIADTTTGSPRPPGRKALWTDFSNNVMVSAAGAFFVGSYRWTEGGDVGQGIYRYADGRLSEVLGDPASTTIPGQPTPFAEYRSVAANDSTVFFVGRSACGEEPAACPEGLYAIGVDGSGPRTILESGAALPGGGTFEQFAVEPTHGIFHSSIATNDAGEIVLVASFLRGEALRQGVFLLKPSTGGHTAELILQSGVDEPALLGSTIESFNTVAINRRGEIAFTVAGAPGGVPEQGLVFYRDRSEGPRSVFKQGDTFLAELMHPSATFETSHHGGLVAGSQSLDSDETPRIFFRHAYVVDNTVFSMMVLATLNPREPS